MKECEEKYTSEQKVQDLINSLKMRPKIGRVSKIDQNNSLCLCRFGPRFWHFQLKRAVKSKQKHSNAHIVPPVLTTEPTLVVTWEKYTLDPQSMQRRWPKESQEILNDQFRASQKQLISPCSRKPSTKLLSITSNGRVEGWSLLNEKNKMEANKKWQLTLQ